MDAFREEPEESWVVRQIGDGQVSYHSFGGPVRHPLDAHMKSEKVAKRVASESEALTPYPGFKFEAVPLDQALVDHATIASSVESASPFKYVGSGWREKISKDGFPFTLIYPGIIWMCFAITALFVDITLRDEGESGWLLFLRVIGYFYIFEQGRLLIKCRAKYILFNGALFFSLGILFALALFDVIPWNIENSLLAETNAKGVLRLSVFVLLTSSLFVFFNHRQFARWRELVDWDPSAGAWRLYTKSETLKFRDLAEQGRNEHA